VRPRGACDPARARRGLERAGTRARHPVAYARRCEHRRGGRGVRRWERLVHRPRRCGEHGEAHRRRGRAEPDPRRRRHVRRDEGCDRIPASRSAHGERKAHPRADLGCVVGARPAGRTHRPERPDHRARGRARDAGCARRYRPARPPNDGRHDRRRRGHGQEQVARRIRASPRSRWHPRSQRPLAAVRHGVPRVLDRGDGARGFGRRRRRRSRNRVGVGTRAARLVRVAERGGPAARILGSGRHGALTRCRARHVAAEHQPVAGDGNEGPGGRCRIRRDARAGVPRAALGRGRRDRARRF